MPLDIMIPYWGDVALMLKMVESVMKQDNPDWLLTVVDDAYPDSAVRERLEVIGDPRITYVRKDVNEGITKNFRTCALLATQELVVIPGSDDLLLPNFVDVVLAAGRRFPEADIIQPGVQVIDEDDRVVSTLVDTVKRRLVMPRTREAVTLGGEQLAASLLRADWLYWPSLVFRRERLVATPFREEFAVIQDLALVIDMVCAGATLLIEPTTCFSYRRHSGSASSIALLDGTRFAGEREYFLLAARQADGLGWGKARRAALRHWTSRMHALTLLPDAVRRPGGVPWALVRHAMRPLRLAAER